MGSHTNPLENRYSNNLMGTEQQKITVSLASGYPQAQDDNVNTIKSQP